MRPMPLASFKCFGKYLPVKGITMGKNITATMVKSMSGKAATTKESTIGKGAITRESTIGKGVTTGKEERRPFMRRLLVGSRQLWNWARCPRRKPKRFGAI